MSQAKPSEELNLKYRLMSLQLRDAEQRFWAHPKIQELYPSLLFRIYSMARASIPLMEKAISRLEPMASSDPLAAGLVKYLSRLIQGERGHDEWVLEDLEALGVRREEVLARVPPPTVASMVGAHYYWILHHHPVAILGYIAVMEAGPASVDEVEAAIHRTGLPRDAFRMYLGHAVLEPQHNDDMERALDTLPFSREHWEMIGVSLAHTTHLSAVSVEEIMKLYEVNKQTQNTKHQTAFY